MSRLALDDTGFDGVGKDAAEKMSVLVTRRLPMSGIM